MQKNARIKLHHDDVDRRGQRVSHRGDSLGRGHAPARYLQLDHGLSRLRDGEHFDFVFEFFYYT